MAMVAGALLDIGGNALFAESASKHRKEFKGMMDDLHTPNVGQLEADYFRDLDKYTPEAIRLTQQMRDAELAGSLKLREQALPGITQATSNAMASIMPLLRGELPSSVARAYQNAGGASTVGSGFGGSGFGFLNTGLFGAKGALGAIQTGMGLLPSLLSTMPQISSPNPMNLLGEGVMNTQARTNLEMMLRQQQIGMNTTLSQMPNRMDVWAAGMKQAGQSLMGGGQGGQQAWSSQDFGMGKNKMSEEQDPFGYFGGGNSSLRFTGGGNIWGGGGGGMGSMGSMGSMAGMV